MAVTDKHKLEYDKKIMGSRIRKLRTKKHKITLQKMADDLQVQQRTVSNWESGNAMPSTEVLIEICNKYECDFEYLLGTQKQYRKETYSVQSLTGLSEKAIDILQEHNSLYMDYNGDDYTDWKGDYNIYAYILSRLIEDGTIEDIYNYITSCPNLEKNKLTIENITPQENHNSFSVESTRSMEDIIANGKLIELNNKLTRFREEYQTKYNKRYNGGK